MDAGASIEVANKDGSTPLHLACSGVSISISTVVSMQWLWHDNVIDTCNSIVNATSLA